MSEIRIDKIIRSNRKTIGLVITQEATLVVRAPLNVPDDYIQKLVHKKRIWIKNKQEQINKRPQVRNKEFVTGEGFLFLGKDYKLQIIDDDDIDIELKNTLTLSKSILPFARERMIEWYKDQAYKKLSERVQWYTLLTGLCPKSVRITNARKRWGSCGNKGNLNFSWRLIMAPIEIIDYVIIHELIHLEEKNHSQNFWNKLRVIIPDYEKRMAWLKHNENLFVI